jgi:hypothetical protein
MEDKNATMETYLSAPHLEHLHKNGIDETVAEHRPYYTIDDQIREYLMEDWGFPEEKVAPEGFVIHKWHLGAEEAPPQIRYDVSRVDNDGNERKYDSVKDSGGVLDFHPLAAHLVDEVEIPLWVAESIKGADALLSHRKLAVGFQGVWGWCQNGRPARAWSKIPLAGRQIYICFDSDVHHRKDLRLALKRFTSYLRYEREALVHIAKVPQPGLEKIGVDDHYGHFADAADAADAVFQENFFTEQSYSPAVVAKLGGS